MVVEAIKVLHQARINRRAEQIGNLIPLPPTARCDRTQHGSRPTCDRHSEPLSCPRPTYQLAGVLSHLSQSHFSYHTANIAHVLQRGRHVSYTKLTNVFWSVVRQAGV